MSSSLRLLRDFCGLAGILQSVNAHALALSLKLELPKINKFVSRWEDGHEILGENQVLIQFLHNTFEAECSIDGVSDNRGVAHCHLTDVAACHASEMNGN